VQVLLVRVDVTEPKFVLRELNALCLRCEWTMILANSIEEAAEYLENFKLVEFKVRLSLCTCASIAHRQRPYFEIWSRIESALRRAPKIFCGSTRLTWATVRKTKDVCFDKCCTQNVNADLDTAIAMLTSVRGVNRSDAQRLLANFGSLRRVAEASIEQLTLCPGLGLHKARRLHTAMRTPFVVDKPATAAAAAEDDDADEEM
jgi:DNA excision repair protein ERCC-1